MSAGFCSHCGLAHAVVTTCPVTSTLPVPAIDASLPRGARAGGRFSIKTSTYAAWQLVESYWVSDRHNLARFVCEQPPYSILTRGIEREVLPVCEKYGAGVIPWSPLHRGYLSGKYRKGQEQGPEAESRASRDQFFDPLEGASGRHKLDVVEELIPMAEELGVSLAEYALAWTLANPVITAPIIGPRVMGQLESVLNVPEITIPAEHLRRIDELVPPGTDL